MIYWELFWSFLQIGLFSFGGGYAALPLIQNQVVVLHGWLSLQEFTDLITISQMTPGPIAINAATFVGMRIAGPGGAILSTLGCIFPSVVISSLLAWLYRRYKEMNLLKGILAGLRPTVAALIMSSGVSILLYSLLGGESFPTDWLSLDWVAAILFLVGLFILRKWKPNPLFIMLGCGVIGGVIYMLTGNAM